MTVPWEGKTKTMRDKLFDVLILGPGVLEKADKSMQDGSDVATLLRIDALKGLLDHFNMLGAWQTELVSTLPENNDSSGNAIPTTQDPEWFVDRGFDVGTWMSFYWMARLTTCATIRVLSQHLPQEHAINTFNHDEFDPHTYAIYIVKGLRQFFTAEASILSFQATALQLGIVLSFLAAFYPKEPNERELIRNMLSDAAQSGPYGPLIFGFLKQMHTQTVQDLDGGHAGRVAAEGWAAERVKGQTWYRVLQTQPRPWKQATS